MSVCKGRKWHKAFRFKIRAKSAVWFRPAVHERSFQCKAKPSELELNGIKRTSFGIHMHVFSSTNPQLWIHTPLPITEEVLWYSGTHICRRYVPGG